MKVYCLFSLESPQRGDSNEYTQYTLFNVKKKIIIPNLQLKDLLQGTQERVQNSRGKRAISVRAIEVSLYIKAAHAIFRLIRTACYFFQKYVSP